MFRAVDRTAGALWRLPIYSVVVCWQYFWFCCCCCCWIIRISRLMSIFSADCNWELPLDDDYTTCVERVESFLISLKSGECHRTCTLCVCDAVHDFSFGFNILIPYSLPNVQRLWVPRAMSNETFNVASYHSRYLFHWNAHRASNNDRSTKFMHSQEVTLQAQMRLHISTCTEFITHTHTHKYRHR